jgi:hypothetical protein
MQHLVGQILGVVNGKTSARDVKKELQSSAERLMNEEMIIAVALIKLKVIQLFSGRFGNFSCFG